ncbi:pyridoxamine 5'-phosphate oxidase family protein [Streptomyces nondiastaticus]|uniref:helix-turn-helix domain-containing protein n=1 Tax=Streptomyces nondiastaticus TaxID=3154512 RepID=UPI00343B8C2B
MSAANGRPPPAQPARPGDVGRRVARRREELGLTREEAAARGGLTPGYFEYVESQPAVIQVDALARLATVLQTSVAHLLGAEQGPPPGETPVPVRPSPPEELSTTECRSRITPGGVGRVVLSTPEGPAALPVSFRFLDDTVVFRTAAGSVLADVVGAEVAFEVDRIDDALGEGWSVLLTGTAEELTHAETIRSLIEDSGPRP